MEVADVIIREATPGMVRALVDMDPVAQTGDHARIADIQTWVREGFALVAVAGSEAVGYVAILPRYFFDRDFIALLIVHPGCRRRGVGRALLEAAVQRDGTDRVFTSTNVSNTPMKALLNSSGWSRSGTLDGFDPGDAEEFYYLDR